MISTARYAMLAILFLATSFATKEAGAELSASPTVGIEGGVSLEIPGPQLFAVQPDEDALLYLWIEDVQSQGESFTYEFRYVGMKAGKHNLLYYLRQEDGSIPQGLQEKYSIEIESALEEDHVGYLTKINPLPIRLFKWYREIVVGLVLLWGVLLVPLIFAGRRVKEEEIAVVPPLSLADRLRPLVVKAVDGEMTLADKALFERLMLGYWCQKLDLDPQEILESLTVIKQHETAGELICTIENWFHKPTGGDDVDIASLLTFDADACMNAYANITGRTT